MVFKTKPAGGKKAGTVHISRRLVGIVEESLTNIDIHEVLNRVAKKDPATYLKFVSKLMPNATELMNLDERDKLDVHAKDKNLSYDERLQRLTQLTGVNIHDNNHASD